MNLSHVAVLHAIHCSVRVGTYVGVSASYMSELMIVIESSDI